MAEISPSRSNVLHALAARWRAFATWWLSELRAAIPAAWLGWIDGRTRPRLLMWRDRDELVCRLASPAVGLREARIPVHRFGSAALGTFLAECGLQRDQTLVGPVLDSTVFFQRELALPKLALAALPNILKQDVLRRTPFQLRDIWHGAVPTGAVNESAKADVRTMRHWIIRRDRADVALAEFGLCVSDVDFLAVPGDDGEALPVISFRPARESDPPWARRAVRILAKAAVGFVFLGLAGVEWCQFGVASRIEASLAEAREGVQGGTARDDFDQTGRLFAIKADVGVLDVWDELSRVLPDHTFLTETRIIDGDIAISGFSADAARLVRLIDQSPLFTQARLVGGITPDATEHKDRFSIAFRCRGARFSQASRDAAVTRSDLP